LGGCCSQRRGCRTEQLRSSIQVHTWANAAFLLVSENYRAVSERRRGWSLMKKVWWWCERWLTSPRLAIERPHTGCWHWVSNRRPRGFWGAEVPVQVFGATALKARRPTQLANRCIYSTVYLDLFSAEKTVETRLQPLCSRDFRRVWRQVGS
jgi:hypothetical protein